MFYLISNNILFSNDLAAYLSALLGIIVYRNMHLVRQE
jgi:hypothetical protein